MLVPDELRKCVFFTCIKTGDGTLAAGTGFFVSMPVDGAKDRFFVYAITAKHVVDGIRKRAVDDALYLRLNIMNGDAQLVETKLDDWVSHPTESSVDVSVLNFAPPNDVVDYMHVPRDIATTPEIIAKEAIGVGDEVAITGLFVNHVGTQRNLPIVRIGNIALMAEEPIQTRDLGPMDAYLVEARSIGGLSGSPVFVNTGGIRTIGGSNRMRGPTFYWLGLMHGHWDVELIGLDESVVDAMMGQSVNMGIGIVVPSDKILEVLDHPDLVESRRASTEEFLKESSPTPDEVKA